MSTKRRVVSLPREPQIGKESSQPQSTVGHLQKVSELCGVLDDCLKVSAAIRSDLFGEAETLGDKATSAPRSSNVESMLYEALTMTCDLRVELERIQSGINPMKVNHSKEVYRG